MFINQVPKRATNSYTHSNIKCITEAQNRTIQKANGSFPKTRPRPPKHMGRCFFFELRGALWRTEPSFWFELELHTTKTAWLLCAGLASVLREAAAAGSDRQMSNDWRAKTRGSGAEVGWEGVNIVIDHISMRRALSYPVHSLMVLPLSRTVRYISYQINVSANVLIN